MAERRTLTARILCVPFISSQWCSFGSAMLELPTPTFAQSLVSFEPNFC
jgi:hypothetical protein